MPVLQRIGKYTDPSMFIERGLFTKVIPLSVGWNYIDHPYSVVDLNLARIDYAETPASRSTISEAITNGILYSDAYQWKNGGWVIHKPQTSSVVIDGGFHVYLFKPGYTLTFFGKKDTADDKAKHDLVSSAVKDNRFLSAIIGTFGKNPEWSPYWELRWMAFNFISSNSVRMYHAMYKQNSSIRYTMFWDPYINAWSGWERVY